MKKVTFTFGRFNPPTAGHQKLVEKVKNFASTTGGDYWIFPSLSQNVKKDPLPHNVKVQYMKKAFPMCADYIIEDKKITTALHAMTFLYDKGYTNVSMVVGSDRMSDFHVLLNKYNDVKSRHGYYKFNAIATVSAGERDPDSEGVEGMSASKLRQAVKDGDEKLFLSGLPNSLSTNDGLKLYKDLQQYMKEWYTEASPEFLKYLQFITPGEKVGPFTKFDSKVVQEYERDYKDEYEKFQSSPEKKKYRAELNKYNREKKTYGNGDGKDASHDKKGKIKGFEDQSKNRGRREKSRLKGSKRKMKTFKEHFDSAMVEEGYKVLGKDLIDPKEYPPIRGMEGPYYFPKSGRILYYDTKVGRYYDRKTDIYLDINDIPESVTPFRNFINENLSNPKEYLTPDFSEITNPRTLSSAKKMVKQAKDDGGVVFHMAGEGHSIQYAQDQNSIEWPGNEALVDGFIKVVYAKDFF